MPQVKIDLFSWWRNRNKKLEGKEMPILQIQNFNHTSLPYTFPKLFSNTSMQNSSSANVYNAVRRVLRKILGQNYNVSVSCHAAFQNNQWMGQCVINGQSYTWIVR
jgi:hypothetical protein